MQRSMTRIRTSHVGRLPSPEGWEDMPGRLASAEIAAPAVIAAQVTPAIAEIVRSQVEVGIDSIGDGEFWTARSLAHYTAHFAGIEARPVAPGGRGEPSQGRRSGHGMNWRDRSRGADHNERRLRRKIPRRPEMADFTAAGVADSLLEPPPLQELDTEEHAVDA